MIRKLEDDTNGPEVPGELQASHEMIGLKSCGLNHLLRL